MITDIAGSQENTLDYLPVEIAEALLRFRDRLLARFPDQIRHVLLYGSFARGTAHAESDVDVLVVAAWNEERLPDGRYVSWGSDPRWKEICDFAFDATLEGGRSVSPLLMGERRFLRNRDVAGEARREGFELLAARIRNGRLEAQPFDRAVAASTILKESGETYEAGEPADLDNYRLWLNLADEKLQAARALLKSAFEHDVISRSYYAMLYAAKAALLLEGVRVKTHQGAVAEFGRIFGATGRIDRRQTAAFARSLAERIVSDYEPALRPTAAEAAEALAGAESFVAAVRELIEAGLRKSDSTA
jgi:uncharacterized protein (UPF0332 family)/predicted nucleotidyltransferase